MANLQSAKTGTGKRAAIQPRQLNRQFSAKPLALATPDNRAEEGKPVETITEFNGDVTAIILAERETKLDIYWQHVTWRYRQANELLVRTMQWFAQSGQAMPESFGNSATMAQAEKRIESLAAKRAPETFAAADSYLNRMREYLAKWRGEVQ